VTLLHGDCLSLMRGLPDGSVDAVVTDPPYELGFMGKAWDAQGIANSPAMWAEVYRVLKPGGHVAAFGGTRTHHRMACAIEDAGFEIRDSLHWLYGSGFPKSHDVSKAIDKAAGADRETVWADCYHDGRTRTQQSGGRGTFATVVNNGNTKSIAATPAAQEWEGYGTALKPAHEPIVLARKPLEGTVAQNVLQWRTGAINIDGCRVAGPSGGGHWTHRREIGDGKIYGGGGRTEEDFGNTNPAGGRWPANLLLTHSASCNGVCAEGCPVAVLDGQSGTLKSGALNPAQITAPNKTYGARPKGLTGEYEPNEGGASRFFPTFAWEPEYDAPFMYCAKASRRERGDGNGHPTVKPVALMRWLCRLITPPQGVVLDPFLGSGTTGVAAVQEGFAFVGIEQEAEYLEIAQERIRKAQDAARQLEFVA
jgi:DNA modification methylase